ncbi:MAG: hypothetical protein M1835_004174 [Candelina submexicana]|nr:MAG: hypothetical protein M1835_004174 [Candelina submexicana]
MNGYSLFLAIGLAFPTFINAYVKREAAVNLGPVVVGSAVTVAAPVSLGPSVSLGATVSLASTATAGATASLGANIDLKTACQFAVLGATSVSNTGENVNVSGSVGVYPGTVVTGFPPGILLDGGTIHRGDALAGTAHVDAVGAYTALTALALTVDLTGTALGPTADASGSDLGGRTLKPGVYSFSSSAGLTGRLTLDGQGDANSVFVIKTGSTLTTAANSVVTLINGAQSCNVFFQVGTSATLGLNSVLYGNVLAQQSIAVTSGTTVNGKLYAINGGISSGSNIAVRAPPTCCNGLAIATSTTATIGGSSAPLGIASLTSATLSLASVSTATSLASISTSSLPTAPRMDGRCGVVRNTDIVDPLRGTVWWPTAVRMDAPMA